jgi:Zn-dependent protease with chaperone function
MLPDGPADLPPIRVKRWPTERPMFVLNAIVAAGLWLVFFVAAPAMLTWVAMIMAYLAIGHLGMVAYVRGSAVRLGPEQFPELFSHIEQLARRIGLRRTPEIYLMQSDGAINAFATRFLRSQIVVLYADLLDACGDNDRARDMIIGHELGHIRAGHTFGYWLLMPTIFIPFVSGALSRAREYTCDRYGRAAAGDDEAALTGLTILSAGRRFAPAVNRRALADQHRHVASGWMIVGEWLSTHPPLSKRLLALAPDLATQPSARQRQRWARPVFAAGVVFLVGGLSMGRWLPSLRGQGRIAAAVEPVAAAAQAKKDLERLRSFVESEVRAGRQLPWDVSELYERWSAVNGRNSGPVDPFSGYWYDYDQRAGAYRLWSMGPDATNRTSDDIVIDSRLARQRRTPNPAPRRSASAALERSEN